MKTDKVFSQKSLITLYEAELKRIDNELYSIESDGRSFADKFQDPRNTPDGGDYHQMAERYHSLMGEKLVIENLLERCKNA